VTGTGPDHTSSRPGDDGGAEAPQPQSGATLAPTPVGPPGAGIFSLEGRRAPGLYLVAWIMALGGLTLTLLIGPMASSDVARFLLVTGGALVTTLGLAAGAGSQILDRRDRHPERYRGPAPLLVFFCYFFALALFGVLLSTAGVVDLEAPAGFLAVGIVQLLGYAAVVWLFAVRSGALTWSDMGWPTWSGRGLGPTMHAIGVAVAVVLPATFGILVISGVLAMLLDVQAPDVLPTPDTSAEALAVAAAAALLVPIGEELFFRGFALTAWMRDLGPRSAIIRSSVFFALIHIVNISTDRFDEGLAQVILQTAAILPLGLLLGWLFVRYGMAAAIGGHVTYNSLLLFLLLLSTSLPQPL
jgi:membrane protease YdiL (CAAX protease family)